MGEHGTPEGIIRKIAGKLSAGEGLSSSDRADFSHALAQLATRIEEVVAILQELVPAVAEAPSVHRPLTPREREMLECVAQGLSNAEIARRSGISEYTVKFHLRNMFDKLGIRRRGQARMLTRELLRRHDSALLAAPDPEAGSIDGRDVRKAQEGDAQQ